MCGRFFFKQRLNYDAPYHELWDTNLYIKMIQAHKKMSDSDDRCCCMPKRKSLACLGFKEKDSYKIRHIQSGTGVDKEKTLDRTVTCGTW
jgi:hypothetical protein